MNNSEHHSYDAAVIGAGPMGSFAAERMARAGLKVVMVVFPARARPDAVGCRFALKTSCSVASILRKGARKTFANVEACDILEAMFTPVDFIFNMLGIIMTVAPSPYPLAASQAYKDDPTRDFI